MESTLNNTYIQKSFPLLILKISFIMLPFFDALNGVFVRQYDFYGIGSYYHIFLLLVFVFVLYSCKYTLSLSKFEILSYGLVVCFLFSFAINSLYDGAFQSISIERVFKIVYTFLFIAFFYRLLKGNYISKDEFDKMVYFQAVTISIITILANLLNIGNVTYQLANSGKIGFYTGSNEPIGIFIIINSYFLVKLKDNGFGFKYVIPFSLIEICLIYAQSKMSYLFAVIFAIVFIFLIIMNFVKNKKIKPVKLLFVLLIIVVVFASMKYIFNSTIDTFLSRQNYQMNNYSDGPLIDYLSTGRTTRFDYLFSGYGTDNVLILILRVFFGQGMNFGYSETFEMDFFDIFLYGGLVALLITLIIFKNIILVMVKKRNLFRLLCLSFVLFFSFFAGHILTGGTSGIYFAMFSVFLIEV